MSARLLRTRSSIARQDRDFKTKDLLQAAHTLARQQPRDIEIIASSLETYGSQAQPTGASYEGSEFLRAILALEDDDQNYKALGQAMRAPHSVQRLAEMDVAARGRDLCGMPPVKVLLDFLTFTGAPEAVQPPDHIIKQELRAASMRLQENITYDDTREGSGNYSKKWSLLALAFMPLLAIVSIVYIVLRLADIADLQSYESKGGYTVYRIIILLVEVFYAYSAVYLLLSRTQRRADPAFSTAVDPATSFVPEGILTILMCSDENAEAISAAVSSHYRAARPRHLSIKVVVVIEQETPGIKKAVVELRDQFKGQGGISVMSYEQLANQAIIGDAATINIGAEAPVQGVLVADDMSPGQALYHALHNLAHHNLKKAAVCVMDASCQIDLEQYYNYAITALQQPGVYTVSTPLHATNPSSFTDFFDAGRNRDKWCRLPGLLAEGKCAVNPKCFMARGYAIYRMLHAMEKRRVKTHSFDWLMYLALENRGNKQAPLAIYDPVHAPKSTYLGHVNGMYIVQDSITDTYEALDVSSTFDRERGRCCSLNFMRPMGAPHTAAVAAALLEFTIVIVCLVIVFGELTPSSTNKPALGVLFLINYLLIVLSVMMTPYGMKFSLAGSAFVNRVMAPVHLLVYLQNLCSCCGGRHGRTQTFSEVDSKVLHPPQRVRPPEAATTAIGEGVERSNSSAESEFEIEIESPTTAVAIYGAGAGAICEGTYHGALGSGARAGTPPRNVLYKKLLGFASSLALLLLVLAIIAFIRGWVVLQRRQPDNYTTAEMVAARGWVVSAMALCVFIAIPIAILLATMSKAGILVRNRLVGTLFVLLSLLLLIIPGVMQLISYAVLDNRDTLLELNTLTVQSNGFMASQMAGSISSLPDVPAWRSNSDVGAKDSTGADLSGGWYTGPGLSKFTYPQAIAVTDLAMSLMAFTPELKEMNAIAGVEEQMMHGVDYLMNAHDRGDKSLISHIYEADQLDSLWAVDAQWTRPESSSRKISNLQYERVNATNGGTETFASVCAAFAAAAAYLDASGGDAGKSSELKQRAAELWDIVSTTSTPYTYSYPQALPLWPSDGKNLGDDKLWAAAWLAHMDPGNTDYVNAVETYYAQAQTEHNAGGLNNAGMNVDDYWWAANALLSMTAPNPRYNDNMKAFMSAWTLKGLTDAQKAAEEASGITMNPKVNKVNDGLAFMKPSFWTATEITDTLPKLYLTPGPLPFTVRAMAYIVFHTASKKTETDDDRDAVCFAQGQLRYMMGINTAERSYIVGVNQYEVTSTVTQPYERASSCSPDPSAPCDDSALASPAPNPSVLLGAIVNGPDNKGAFKDVRGLPANTGVGILNNSPLPMLTAGLWAKDLKIKDCIGYEKAALEDGTTTTTTN